MQCKASGYVGVVERKELNTKGEKLNRFSESNSHVLLLLHNKNTVKKEIHILSICNR